MNRRETRKQVFLAVRNFSVDDVKDWLCEATTTLASLAYADGNVADHNAYLKIGAQLAAIQNEGV